MLIQKEIGWFLQLNDFAIVFRKVKMAKRLVVLIASLMVVVFIAGCPAIESEPVEPAKTEVLNIEPAKSEPNEIEPAVVEPVEVTPAPSESNQIEPDKVEPVYIEPEEIIPEKACPERSRRVEWVAEGTTPPPFGSPRIATDPLILPFEVRHSLFDIRYFLPAPDCIRSFL